MSHNHLNTSERALIEHFFLNGHSLRAIARQLGRCHSTISREVKRNKASPFVYSAETASSAALKRRREATTYPKRSHKELLRYTRRKLRSFWSPEQICGRLPLDFPEDKKMRLSPESVYRWVYEDAGNGGTLFNCLRRARKKRRPKGFSRRYGPHSAHKSIHDRPESVLDRQQFGHWEGDMIMGRYRKSGMITLVERTSRYLLAQYCHQTKSGQVASRIIQMLNRKPHHARRSLTLDNGPEFAAFGMIERHTGADVYFADPYSPWQRGTNENCNGLVRQFYPKRTDISKRNRTELAKTLRLINSRPRKILNYKTASEVFKEMSGAFQT